MHFTRFRSFTVVPLVFSLSFVLAACSKKILPSGQNGLDSFACGNQQVAVDPVNGTNPKAVYLCQGFTLTWAPNGHSFTVTFPPQKYPFQGPPQTFASNPANLYANVVSPPAIYPGLLTVYNYTMTVDDKPVQDPQVVGGGQHSN